MDVDRLGPALQVLLLHGAAFGVGGPREPHRHDYHELIWTRSGEGRHLIDGEPSPVEPGSITLIGRGQVHVFETACNLDGAVIRFTDELLSDTPVWLLGARGARAVRVPEARRLEAVIDALHSESQRPPDPRSAALQRHLLSVLLLWIERWYDASRTQQREPDDAETQLYRRFTAVLERDFARHHDATHYADALATPPAALSKALAHVTGHPTKELITERVMLEAARLLRFTDLTIGEIAHRAGFTDQLYFSRAFKRRYDVSPSAYREKSMHPRDLAIPGAEVARETISHEHDRDQDSS